MANSVHWHGYLLRMENGHVSRILRLEIEGQRKKRRSKVMEKQD